MHTPLLHRLLAGSTAFLLVAVSPYVSPSAQAGLIEVTGGSDVTGMPAVFPDGSLYENTTGHNWWQVSGQPAGGGGGWPVESDEYLIYNFHDQPITDLAGPDFNVYEQENGGAEIEDKFTVSVSNDGTNFVDVTSTFGDALDLMGDEAHAADSMKASYDLAGSGLSEAQFLHVAHTDGVDGAAEIDSVGRALPEPASGVLMGLGASVLGFRRRRA